MEAVGEGGGGGGGSGSCWGLAAEKRPSSNCAQTWTGKLCCQGGFTSTPGLLK